MERQSEAPVATATRISPDRMGRSIDALQASHAREMNAFLRTRDQSHFIRVERIKAKLDSLVAKLSGR